MNGPHPESIHLTQLIGTAVNNADEELVGTAQDLLVSRDGGITAMLLDTGGILGVGKTTVLVPFSECAIIERDGTASIVLPRLHSGEVLVAPEYQVPGGTRFERITNHASTLGHVVITKAGELSKQAAEKSAVLVQKTVDRAAGLDHKGAEKVTEPAHEDDKK